MELENNILAWAKSRIAWLERELCIETARRIALNALLQSEYARSEQLEAQLRDNGMHTEPAPDDDPDEAPFGWIPVPKPGQWQPGTTAGKDCRGNVGAGYAAQEREDDHE